MGKGFQYCVSVLQQNWCLNSTISKFKHDIALKLGNLRESDSLQDGQVLTGKYVSQSEQFLKQEKLIVHET